MSSLADLPELIGFFSYSREDDEDFKGTLTGLHEGIQRELRRNTCCAASFVLAPTPSRGF